MKKFSCATIVLAFVLAGIHPLPAQVQGQWTTVGTMQSDREFNAQVPLAGGKALSAGGVDNNNNVLASA